MRCGGLFAAVDALGDADAVVGVAGEGQRGVAGGELFDAGDAVEVADVVLGHRARPAGDVGPERVRRVGPAGRRVLGGRVLARSASGRSASSGCSAPPTKTRMRTPSAGERPGNFWLAKLAAMMRRFSIRGTTKPKLSSGWLICERRQARLTTVAARRTRFRPARRRGLGSAGCEDLCGGVGGEGEDDGVEGGLRIADCGVVESRTEIELPAGCRRGAQ